MSSPDKLSFSIWKSCIRWLLSWMSCKQPLKWPPQSSALPGSGCPPMNTSEPAPRACAGSCPSSTNVSDCRAPTEPPWKDRATKCLLPSATLPGKVRVSVGEVSMLSWPSLRYRLRQGPVLLQTCTNKPSRFRLRRKKERLNSAPRLSERVKKAKLVEFSRPNVAAGCSGREKNQTQLRDKENAAGTGMQLLRNEKCFSSTFSTCARVMMLLPTGL